MPPKPTPRRAAQALLAGVLDQGKMMSDLTGPTLDALSPGDRATAQRLAAGTLRMLGGITVLLDAHLTRQPPDPVLRVLQMATYELGTGGAAHGVVNDAVAIVGGMRKHRHLKGLANAVLRKVAADAPDRWAKLPPATLPPWLRRPIAKTWGKGRVRAIEAAHTRTPPLDLTARGDAAALAQAVGGTLLPTGSVRVPAGTQVSALPGYDAGAFWVQDAAAALPVRLLGDVTGKRALDLCAAPGGKTLQLAAGGADVTAVDLSARRVARLRENLTRTGLTATVRVTDAFKISADKGLTPDQTGTQNTGPWDVVVLDAPCTATGTLRRHPDLPHVKTAEAPDTLVALQARLLDHALTVLAPTGRLVYCTCSLLPAEGEDQIAAALERHHDVQVVPPEALRLGGNGPDGWPDGWPDEWKAPGGGLRLRPDHWDDHGGLDGFYMAVLQRRAPQPD